MSQGHWAHNSYLGDEPYLASYNQTIKAGQEQKASGRILQHAKCSDDRNSLTARQVPESSGKVMENNSATRNRPRRPEMQHYVPRARRSQTDGSSSTEGQGDHHPEPSQASAPPHIHTSEARIPSKKSHRERQIIYVPKPKRTNTDSEQLTDSEPCISMSGTKHGAAVSSDKINDDCKDKDKLLDATLKTKLRDRRKCGGTDTKEITQPKRQDKGDVMDHTGKKMHNERVYLQSSSAEEPGIVVTCDTRPAAQSSYCVENDGSDLCVAIGETEAQSCEVVSSEVVTTHKLETENIDAAEEAVENSTDSSHVYTNSVPCTENICGDAKGGHVSHLENVVKTMNTDMDIEVTISSEVEVENLVSCDNDVEHISTKTVPDETCHTEGLNDESDSSAALSLSDVSIVAPDNASCIISHDVTETVVLPVSSTKDESSSEGQKCTVSPQISASEPERINISVNHKTSHDTVKEMTTAKLVENDKDNVQLEETITAATNPEEDADESWDTMFDDEGEALDPQLLEELTTAVGKVEVQHTQFDYLNFQPKDLELDYSEYGHLVEIYDFPTDLITRDLIVAFNDYKDRGFDIKWVDDSHAIGIFASNFGAHAALSLKHPLIKVRPISQATRQTKVKAKHCVEFLQPYKERPETSAAVARNLVAGALGIRSNVAQDKRREERKKLQEARDKKRSEKKQKKDAWEGSYGRCAMDEEC